MIDPTISNHALLLNLRDTYAGTLHVLDVLITRSNERRLTTTDVHSALLALTTATNRACTAQVELLPDDLEAACAVARHAAKRMQEIFDLVTLE